MGVGPGDQILELVGIEVLVAGVDRRELAAVNGEQLAAEEIELAAEQGKLAVQSTDGFEVVLAEVGNGLEVGILFAGEPDDLDIAPAFGFEQAGRSGRDADNHRDKV